MEMLEDTFLRKLLPEQLCFGILNLIPKPDKDPTYLKILRPITLLCTDYKIIEKAIGNRLMVSLHSIISMDQKGFMPGRKISTNIHKVFDLMKYCELHDVDAIVLSLDFEKCFDKIETSAILGALKFFDFSEYLQEWVKMLYQDFKAVIQNNGNFSENIRVEKSVHQGGPC